MSYLGVQYQTKIQNNPLKSNIDILDCMATHKRHNYEELSTCLVHGGYESTILYKDHSMSCSNDLHVKSALINNVAV